MFTGIITDIGTIRSVTQRGDLRIEIATGYDVTSVDMGASIACDGVCLTVVEKTSDSFCVDVSAESAGLTTIGDWKTGRPVNLERALKVGDELGGHIVSGHVDGVGEVTSLSTDADSHRFSFSVPTDLSRQIAAKGSITIDGISLTVNEVGENTFGVNIIPHTMAVTSIGKKQIGDAVNLEVDMLARYVARLLNKD